MKVHIDPKTGGLIGSRLAKADFRIMMFLWKRSLIVYLCQLALFLLPALALGKPVAFLPVVILLLYWIGVKGFYPYRPVIFNYIKFALLVPGITVKIDDDKLSSPCEPHAHDISEALSHRVAELVSYDIKTDKYTVKIGTTVRYYLFKEITPLYYPECRKIGALFSGWDRI